jgi:hypothetical protein
MSAIPWRECEPRAGQRIRMDGHSVYGQRWTKQNIPGQSASLAGQKAHSEGKTCGADDVRTCHLGGGRGGGLLVVGDAAAQLHGLGLAVVQLLRAFVKRTSRWLTVFLGRIRRGVCELAL